jgi:hypothetical protein
MEVFDEDGGGTRSSSNNPPTCFRSVFTAPSPDLCIEPPSSAPVRVAQARLRQPPNHRSPARHEEPGRPLAPSQVGAVGTGRRRVRPGRAARPAGVGRRWLPGASMRWMQGLAGDSELPAIEALPARLRLAASLSWFALQGASSRLALVWGVGGRDPTALGPSRRLNGPPSPALGTRRGATSVEHEGLSRSPRAPLAPPAP